MRILDALADAIASGQPVVYTLLVETRGSTPQKPGAEMLVFPDGRQVGTLGGGCVEAEVKRRALELLPVNQAELLTFTLDNDYGWDDGLICGGRMTMLVDPINSPQAGEPYRTLRDLLVRGDGATQAVVLKEDPSHGLPPATRFIFDADGTNADASQETPRSIREALRPLADRPRPYVTGGVAYLPQLPRCRLVIVGAGHVGQKVAELATQVDFEVTVIDDRQQYCNAERFPTAARTIVGPIHETLPDWDVGPHSFGIIVTRGHHHDEEALQYLAPKPWRYLGMIGSRRKIKLIFRDLLEKGITTDQLRAVHAPLGFHIGSQTVPEIAVSIVAELIAHRNLGGVPEKCRPESLVDELLPV